MYVCELCSVVSSPGEKCLLHREYAISGGLKQIERETKVCRACYDALGLGIPRAELSKENSRFRLRSKPRIQSENPISTTRNGSNGHGRVASLRAAMTGLEVEDNGRPRRKGKSRNKG